MGCENSRTGGLIARRVEMADYKNLMNLVEEVRGLVSYDEVQNCKDHAASALSEYLEDQLEDSLEDSLEEADKVSGKFKKGTEHNPFRYLKKGKALGPGPKGRIHKPTRYWTCRCSNYRCLCRGSEGERKRVNIGRGYKKTYNNLYRRWKAKHASRFKPGKVFRSRKQK
jgi:hypothetical protein